jgi:hypothetical protein
VRRALLEPLARAVSRVVVAAQVVSRLAVAVRVVPGVAAPAAARGQAVAPERREAAAAPGSAVR